MFDSLQENSKKKWTNCNQTEKEAFKVQYVCDCVLAEKEKKNENLKLTKCAHTNTLLLFSTYYYYYYTIFGS